MPPAPMPWTTRHAISIPTDWLSPATSEPAEKTTIATCIRLFLPSRSESLPHRGVEAVVASRVEVTTQVYAKRYISRCDPA